MPDKLLVGLIGAGIQQSLTPAMQEEEARQQGLRLHYQLIDVDCTPMCSPRFLAEWQEKHSRRRIEPADLTDLPHINPADPWLAQWMAEMGVAMPDVPARPGVLLDSQTAEGTATMASRGIGTR